MRVGIDAHMVGERETGNETYIVGLAEGLRALGSPHTYRLLTPHPERLHRLGEGTGDVRARRTLRLPAPLRIPFGLPVASRHERLDLLHVTYVAPPASVPVVVLVHDVAYHLFPETFSPRLRWQLSLLIPLSIARARRLLTDTEAGRRDLEALYPAARGKTAAVHLGVRSIFRPIYDADVLAAVRARYCLPARFLLSVGDLQPRKNLGALLDAFAALAPRHPDLDLVIVGKDKWRGASVAARVHELGLGPRVHLTGYVPDADLVALYNLAAAFVYPSRYEGFGLPPIEAMACGLPTITSTAAAIAEVVGDAALTIPPDDTLALAAAIEQVIADPDLSLHLAAAGRTRADRYTWLRTARCTEHVFEEALREDVTPETRRHEGTPRRK